MKDPKCLVSRWYPEDVVGAAILGAAGLAFLASIGRVPWPAVINKIDMSRCCELGGYVEHLRSPSHDWRCVGATPERAP